MELDNLESKWGKKYSIVIKSWRNKWEHLSAYFKYPEEIRRIIYTTNIIESVHRQFRKLTKTKGASQMKIVFSNFCIWVFRMLLKNGLCLLGIGH